ncbi:MAG: hypothetical protein LM577_07125 [Thermoproteaceae archaeon]|nr:hypothetical protein [Thermoproteaceae archaeon]
MSERKKEAVEFEVEVPYLIDGQCLERLEKYLANKVRQLVLKYGAAEVRIEMEVELRKRSWLEGLFSL